MHAQLVVLNLAQIARRKAGAPFDPDLVDAGRCVGRQLIHDHDPYLVPGEAHLEPHAQPGRGLFRVDGRLVDFRRRGSVPRNHSFKVAGQIGIGGAPIRRKATRPAIDLDRVEVEVLAANGAQHAGRSGHGHTGLAQEALDLVLAGHPRYQTPKALARGFDLGGHLVGRTWQLTRAVFKKAPLHFLGPGQKTDDPQRPLRIEDLGGDFAQQAEQTLGNRHLRL